jgi:signal peptidase I
VYNGDRILVLKCLYQFSPPKRWDVVVFKNPTNPTQNYIKRLIGLPGETIEIVDGDLYVNGRIARKPPMVQEELWMPIYDNDYQPVHPERPAFNRHPWQMPFDLTGSAWTVDQERDPTRLHLAAPTDRPNVLTYGAPPSANDFRAVYAYNDLSMGKMPNCNDLMVRFYVDFHTQAGQVGVTLTRYGTRYQGSVDSQGHMELAQITGDERSVLGTADLQERASGPSLSVKFAHVDRQLVLQVGRQRLVHDLDGSRSTAGTQDGPEPQVQLFGAGQLTVADLAIFRDIYYTSQMPHYNRSFSHATEGHPFELQADEFFVLGDNSPNSEDARWWPAPTTASRGQQPPRAGVVPRDYLMGKALFVYWPGGFEFPWPKSIRAFAEAPDQPGPLRILQELIKLKWIPNVGKMRFIYGGCNPNMRFGTPVSEG